jgi:hypothetical protein
MFLINVMCILFVSDAIKKEMDALSMPFFLSGTIIDVLSLTKPFYS